MYQPGYMCLLAVEDTQQHANRLIIPQRKTVHGHPVRNEPELGVDHELQPNTGCNLTLVIKHTQWCVASVANQLKRANC